MELKVEDAKKHYEKYLKIHEKRFAKIIEHVTSGDVDNKSKSILDVGCHSLILLSTLRDMGYRNVHGIDVPLFIEAFDLDTINRFNLKNCDLQNDAIPFEDNKFDIIIMSEVIEHLFFNPTECYGSKKDIEARGQAHHYDPKYLPLSEPYQDVILQKYI